MRPQQRRAYYREGMDTVDIAEHYEVHESVIYNNTGWSMSRKGTSGYIRRSKNKETGALFGEMERIHQLNIEASKKYIKALQYELNLLQSNDSEKSKEQA